MYRSQSQTSSKNLRELEKSEVISPLTTRKGRRIRASRRQTEEKGDADDALCQVCVCVCVCVFVRERERER